MLCDVICDNSYFVTSSMIIQSRSNCDAATGNILRQHYQRPYFLPRSAESSKTDWIFMGSPGYGAHMHVSGHVLFIFKYYYYYYYYFVFWSRTILQASTTSFPRFPASGYVTLQTSVSGILSCHSPSLNFRYPSLSRPKPCSGILPCNASRPSFDMLPCHSPRPSFRRPSRSLSKPQFPVS